MAISIVFETHSMSEDNESRRASGWHHSRLSTRGRKLAEALGQRRQNDQMAAVFTSDLRRATETTEIACSNMTIPILHDWRLRECDYGDMNGMDPDTLHKERKIYLARSYPNGESWQEAVSRVGRFLSDLKLRWDGSRVLVIGHVATRWGLDHYLNGVSLESLMDADFAWQEGWEYQLSA